LFPSATREPDHFTRVYRLRRRIYLSVSSSEVSRLNNRATSKAPPTQKKAISASSPELTGQSQQIATTAMKTPTTTEMLVVFILRSPRSTYRKDSAATATSPLRQCNDVAKTCPAITRRKTLRRPQLLPLHLLLASQGSYYANPTAIPELMTVSSVQAILLGFQTLRRRARRRENGRGSE